jgi:hypothetical protein
MEFPEVCGNVVEVVGIEVTLEISGATEIVPC